MNELPVTHDLPPHRQAEIRAELEHVVAAVGAQRTRPRLTPLATAAAAVLVLGVTAALATLPGGHREPTDAGSPGQLAEAAAAPGQPTASARPSQPAQAGPPAQVMSDLSEEQLREIERGCVTTAFGQSGDGASAAAGSDGAPATVVPSSVDIGLYNVVDTDAGQFAYLYGSEYAALCTLDWPGVAFNAGFQQVNRARSPQGLIEADYLLATTNGGDVNGKESSSGRPGVDLAAGRIGPGVARLTLTVDTDTVDATLANGTFLATIARPSTWQAPETARSAVLRAYDATGNPLDEVSAQTP